MRATHHFCHRFLCGLSIVNLGMASLLLLLTGSRAALAADDKTVEQIKGDERVAVLRLLAAHNEANYRKIQTWRGKYHFVDRFPTKIQIATKKKSSPEQFEMRDVIAIREGTMEFALDATGLLPKKWSMCYESL